MRWTSTNRQRALDQRVHDQRESDLKEIADYLRASRHDPMITYEEDADHILRLLGR